MVAVNWGLLRVSKLSDSGVGTTVVLGVDSRVGTVADGIAGKLAA